MEYGLPGSTVMTIDQVVADLSTALTEQLKIQLSALMAEAQASIRSLEQQLLEERQRREQAQQQLEALQQSHQAVKEELVAERQARAAADQQVQTIHAAIAEQLDHAEAEHAAEQAARAEQERGWTVQLETLRGELLQERQWRDQQQRRIETLRHAAAALLVDELPFPALQQPRTPTEVELALSTPVTGLLAGHGAQA